MLHSIFVHLVWHNIALSMHRSIPAAETRGKVHKWAQLKL